MEINRVSNTNFQGGFKIVGEEICPQYLLHKLNDNHIIKTFIAKNPKNLQVTIKYREAKDWEVKRQSRDEDLYKIIFKSSYPEDTWYGKFLNFLFSKSSRLANDSDYHSEHTNMRYLANEEHMKKIFHKLA